MRITTNTMYESLLNNVNKNLSDYHKYNEMISNERRINKISDDPAGVAIAMKHKGNSSAYDRYVENISDAEEYLKATDSALNHIQDIVVRAREIALTASTETASDMEKQVAADQIQQIIDESIGIANTKMRDRYLFAGTNGNEPAYSLNGRVLQPYASTDNVYNDVVTVNGEYEGTGDFIVKFVESGTVNDNVATNTAKYQVSQDGGETWSETIELGNNTANIIDKDGNDTGLSLDFKRGFLEVGDEFRLNVVAGNYQGDDANIAFNNNSYSRITTNVTGQQLFEDTGYFDSLYQLKYALDNGNNIEISDAIGKLDALQSNMQPMVTASGLALNRLEISKNNLVSLQENVLESIQGIEKVDAVEVLTKFAMTEKALNSAVAALSKMFPTSLTEYL
ncbi:MAG: flagellar hook-associated protein FlgL [Candidatus Cloacimonetes bacterium]|nr:flagellar hook-associated protein FlgL [Candidatus Cloacimonadota bacterium]